MHPGSVSLFHVVISSFLPKTELHATAWMYHVTFCAPIVQSVHSELTPISN